VGLVWEKHYKNGKLPNHIRKGFFWWRDNLKLLQTFKSFSRPQINSGYSVLFWFDAWHGQSLDLSYSELFSFALNKQIPVRKVLDVGELTSLF
jgi:hypothetical protein